MAKVGRKPKYQPEMCEIAKQSLADGYSKEATAGILGIGKTALYAWIEEKPEFADAIEEGESLSQQWWEDKGRQACVDGQLNATVWSMNMKNRFKWSDKQDHTHSGPGGKPMQTESRVVFVGVDKLESTDT